MPRNSVILPLLVAGGGLLLAALVSGCATELSPEKNGFEEVYIHDLLNRKVTNTVEKAGTRADRLHDALFLKVQEAVSKMDRRFVKEGEEPDPVPASRFRIGVYGEVVDGERTEYKFDPEFDIDLNAPNIEKTLKLFITTEELGELPGTDVTDRDQGLRIGISREMLESFDIDLGVKWDWPPNPFVQLKWNADWKPGRWDIYPGIKGYYRVDDGFGATATTTADRWFGRALIRNSSGCGWQEDTNGVSWSHTFILAYASELINEDRLGDRAGGKDLAKGVGLRYRISGESDTRRIESHEALLMTKFPVRKRWAYFVIAPGVEFRNEREWEAETSLQLGFDLLFWDVGDR